MVRFLPVQVLGQIFVKEIYTKMILWMFGTIVFNHSEIANGQSKVFVPIAICFDIAMEMECTCMLMKVNF